MQKRMEELCFVVDADAVTSSGISSSGKESITGCAISLLMNSSNAPSKPSACAWRNL